MYDISNVCKLDIDDVLKIAADCGLSGWSRQDYQDELNRGDSIFIAAKRGSGESCGFIIGRFVPGSGDGSQDVEIYNIGVSSEYRRSGIGSLLIGSFMRTAARNDAKAAFLEVRSGNYTAINFYKKHGFSVYASRASFYRNPVEDATLMRAVVYDLDPKIAK